MQHLRKTRLRTLRETIRQWLTLRSKPAALVTCLHEVSEANAALAHVNPRQLSTQPRAPRLNRNARGRATTTISRNLSQLNRKDLHPRTSLHSAITHAVFIRTRRDWQRILHAVARTKEIANRRSSGKPRPQGARVELVVVLIRRHRRSSRLQGRRAEPRCRRAEPRCRRADQHDLTLRRCSIRARENFTLLSSRGGGGGATAAPARTGGRTPR